MIMRDNYTERKYAKRMVRTINRVSGYKAIIKVDTDGVFEVWSNEREFDFEYFDMEC